MTKFKSIAPEALEGNVFSMIGKQWMLITAGAPGKFNTMTASWGGLGVLWSKPVAFCFIRPQRYTLQFIEKSDMYTLSFFNEKYRDVLNFCGKYSGRDRDKVHETGLTPYDAGGSVCFEEASTVLVCRKMYEQGFDPLCFADKTIDEFYTEKDYHRQFVGSIQKILVK